VPPTETPFQVLSREIYYRIDERYNLTFSKRIRLRSLRDGTNAFLDKIAWSGGAAGLPRCSADRACVVRPSPDRHGLWDYFRVEFAAPLRSGQETVVELRWPNLGNWTNSKPFVSTSVPTAGGRVRFDVHIPKAARNSDECFLETLGSVDAADPLDRGTAAFDQSGDLRWDIDAPEHDRHFRIAWLWHPIITGPLPEPAAAPQNADDQRGRVVGSR